MFFLVLVFFCSLLIVAHFYVAHLYTALISKDEYIQSEVKKIDKLLKGNVKHLFAAFCSAENLTKTDIEEIDDLWQKKKEEMLHHE